jgi:hypothetical protein
LRHRFGVWIGALAAACVLAAPAAHAFTMQNKDAPDSLEAPKFDLDEQMRNFRKDGTDLSSASKKALEMPFGDGKLQFDVRSGSSQDLFSSGLGLGPAPRNTREDFNRVVTPENLR